MQARARIAPEMEDCQSALFLVYFLFFIINENKKRPARARG
jgi:hypothetical protein